MKKRKTVYSSLAATNLKKHGKLYIPFIITSALSVMMFYLIMFLAENKGLDSMSGGEQIILLMKFGAVVIGIFSVIFLFYTNSFLMKNRKKEIGLYNILGMEKKHIAVILFFETLYVALIAIIGGVLLGIVFSKLMLMILGNILQFNISFKFSVSISSVIVTILLFALIFVLILFSNLARMTFSNPIELLHGSNVGEKEPKTKWILAILGVAFLAVGYYLALTVESPIEALGAFFIAVILVIIGTYLVFCTSSIAILKSMRKNKKYYYKTKHFTTVSGMIYRMKQNAIGLANICVLASMVLVTVSTTVSLYFGFEDALHTMYPFDIGYDISHTDKESCEKIIESAKRVSETNGIEIKDSLSYRYRSITLQNRGNGVFGFKSDEMSNDQRFLIGIFLPLDEYNRMENADVTLKDDEILIMTENGRDSDLENITFENKNYNIKEHIKEFNTEELNLRSMITTYYFIFPDEASITDCYKAMGGEEAIDETFFNFYYGINLDCTSEQQLEVYKDYQDSLTSQKLTYREAYVKSAADMRQGFLSIYGGLFFLGIFLALIFVMATVLIIYYKQISEGYDDKSRFEIMQKVGMEKSEIKSTVRSQVMTVFFLPLIAAAIHVAFAFKMITKLLALLSITNIALFAWCTVGTVLLFGVLYAIVYSMTARTYYKIVN